MKTIMLLNPKGGCGKTTVATNLCAYYAAKGIKTALMDFDPQGSAMRWAAQRQKQELPKIQAIDGGRPMPGVTRSWQLHTEPGTELVIVDTPAAFDRNHLLDFVARANILLVPVMPSHIDIHAAAHFIQDLLLVAKVRRQNKQIGLVANRVRENTKAFHALERFLYTLDIPMIARLRDAQNYIQASESGRGIHELLPSRTGHDRWRWRPLIQWLATAGTEGSAADKPKPHRPLVMPTQLAGALR